MRAAWVVTAIALGAAAFMLRFLTALLRENAPSACYGVSQSDRNRRKKRNILQFCAASILMTIAALQKATAA